MGKINNIQLRLHAVILVKEGYSHGSMPYDTKVNSHKTLG